MFSRECGLKLYTLMAALLLSAGVPQAAEPPSGTAGQAGDRLDWTGGPFTSVNPSTGGCVEGISCDTFALNLAIPPGKVARVDFRIEWENEANDFDLFIFDENGAEVDNSGQGLTEFEQVAISNMSPGVYQVVVNAFAAVNAAYTGRIVLESVSDAPPPPPAPELSSGIRFSNNTMVDFSAVSGEPFIKADNRDNIFVSAPFGFSTTVSLLWRSGDGGRTFVPLGTPTVRDAVIGPGGGDTHFDFDADNFLYYVDLSALCVTAAVSSDEGNTFPPERNNPVACASEEHPEAAADDRQWVAAFGKGIAYVTFRNLLTAPFWLFKTEDGGLSYDGGTLLGNVGQSGPIQVDKQKRLTEAEGVEKEAILVYQIFYRGSDLRLFRVIDFDDGSPFVIDDLRIADPGASVGNVFPVLAIDSAGNLYAVWSQGAADIFLAASADRGETWSTPVKVSPFVGTNTMPWVAAGDPGRVDVVWYRSPLKGNPPVPESEWDIFLAQSLNGLDAQPSFEVARVNQNVIHRGELCLSGLDCDISTLLGTPRDRSFLEFPSVTVDSRGAAVVTYNDNTNQAGAPYVMVAKQVGGPSVIASVGTLDDPGSVAIDSPSQGSFIDTPGLLLTGSHSLPPANFDKDEGGDARFPDHGAVIGENIPALDIQSVSMEKDGDSIVLKMRIADLRPEALTAAPLQSGGDGVLYLTQWDFNDDIFWLAAEVRAGVAVFSTGTISTIDSASSKKYITYNPDLEDSLQVQGSITPTAPGTIEIRAPKSLLGNPQSGDAFFSVTAYTMSQRGPLLPVGSLTAPDPTSLPLQVDASGAATYPVGESPRAAGVVEVSLDDPDFSAPRLASLTDFVSSRRWELELEAADLTPGAHTAYVRQGIEGLAFSPLASVDFTVSDTVEQLVNQHVSLQTANPQLSNGVASFDLRIGNESSEPIFTPLRAEVAQLTSASGQVTVANSDNGGTGVGAFWDYSGQVGPDARLAPGELSTARQLRFNDAAGESFSLLLDVIGRLSRPLSDSSASFRSGQSSDDQVKPAKRAALGQQLRLTFRITVNPLLKRVTVDLVEIL